MDGPCKIICKENGGETRVEIKGNKAEEGSALNKLLNKRGARAHAIVEQTGRTRVRDIYRRSAESTRV